MFPVWFRTRGVWFRELSCCHWANQRSHYDVIKEYISYRSICLNISNAVAEYLQLPCRRSVTVPDPHASIKTGLSLPFVRNKRVAIGQTVPIEYSDKKFVQYYDKNSKNQQNKNITRMPTTMQDHLAIKLTSYNAV